MAIALVGEVVCAFLRSDLGEDFSNRCDQSFDGSGGGLSQQGFELGEELLDRIEVGTVGRQVAQLGACGFDRFADAGDLVACKVIHHHDIARLKDRDDELFDISAKAFPIHRSVQHTGRGDLAEPQCGNEGRRFPMSPRHAANEALAARTAAVAARHVGRRTGFVDKDEAFRLQFGLVRTPPIAGLGDIRPILFGSAQ